MSWSSVIGQKRAKGMLQSSLDTGRVAHAYLFLGPYGVGKRAAALEFAKALQCEVNDVDPCGTCTNCSRIDRMIHPDVRFFYPAPNDTSKKDMTERITAVGLNPYETLDFVRRPKARGSNLQVLYPVSFIRETIKESIIDFKSFEGGYKVVVIMCAEVLGERAGNAFLKILEEPSDRTVFILITERPDMLLPTILSRCQPVRFDPIAADIIESVLVARAGIDASTAGSLARLADGSYSMALDLIHDEVSRAFRESLLPFMRSVYSNDTFDVLTRVETISKQGLDRVKLFLILLLGWIRDLILVRELGSEAHIVNVDVRESLERFCANLVDARLDQMAELVEEAIALVSRNVRVALVLIALAAGLRRSMMGKRALPLTTPLADQFVTEIE